MSLRVNVAGSELSESYFHPIDSEPNRSPLLLPRVSVRHEHVAERLPAHLLRSADAATGIALMKKPTAYIVDLVLLSTFTASFGQSGPAFDCAKAEHEIEQLTCKDEILAAKDRK